MQKVAIVLPTYLVKSQPLISELQLKSVIASSSDLPGSDLIQLSARVLEYYRFWENPHDWQRPGRESPALLARPLELL